MIPTGSMAPTLMGKHKDLECPMCHYRYQVSASDHQTTITRTTRWRPRSTMPRARCAASRRTLTPRIPRTVVSELRWRPHPGGQVSLRVRRSETLGRDRFQVPRRRDDELHQAAGGVARRDDPHSRRRFVDPPKPDQPEGHFEIARKPPEKILAMLQPVYDNDLAPTITGTLDWPARWTPEPGLENNAWTTARTFPRSRSRPAPRARPGFVTGIGCRRPSSGMRLPPPPASRAEN